MFWPLEIPFAITFWALLGLVGIFTLLAPLFKQKRTKMCLLSVGVACFLFVPSCIGVHVIVDHFRFGVFSYANYGEITDFRAKRYLPPAATKITMQIYSTGYRAQYRINNPDFHAYLNELWETYGKVSSHKRGECIEDGAPADREEMESRFSDLGWPLLNNPVKFRSPSERDGGGASYYYDEEAGIVYQDTAHW